MTRPTYLAKTFSAGCFVCHGGEGHWFGKNAQAVAARHYDATGHATWCDIGMMWRYGEEDNDSHDEEES